MTKAYEWDIADEISDRIVDLINQRTVEMKERNELQPLQLLAGQLLGLMSTFRTMPPFGQPLPLIELQDAVTECLQSMMKAKTAS